MRIISGNNRGRKIIIPKKLSVRPTTDQSKEAIFNIINNEFFFEDLKVLDLFSGSGNISYEFASRGAKEIYSIDINFNCIKFIKKISEQLNLNLKVIKSDALNYLNTTKLDFNIIFLDPPYSYTESEYLKIINKVFEKNLLINDGYIIAEHSEKIKLDDHKKFVKSKNYGGCSFSFFKI